MRTVMTNYYISHITVIHEVNKLSSYTKPLTWGTDSVFFQSSCYEICGIHRTHMLQSNIYARSKITVCHERTYHSSINALKHQRRIFNLSSRTFLTFSPSTVVALSPCGRLIQHDNCLSKQLRLKKGHKIPFWGIVGDIQQNEISLVLLTSIKGQVRTHFPRSYIYRMLVIITCM